MNRQIASNEIESIIIIKKLPIKKCSGLDDYTSEFYFTSSEYSGLISLRIDWFDLLAV